MRGFFAALRMTTLFESLNRQVSLLNVRTNTEEMF
jgi:hypothetical protein